MTAATANPDLPLGVRLFRAYLRSPLRGRTRVAGFLARHLPALHCVPIRVGDWPPVFMDLRLGDALGWLRDSPWSASPLEPDEQRVMERVVRPGDTIFDIGANLGLHTVLLSRLAGPHGMVVAFEPNPLLVPCLRKTMSGLANARLVEAALSDQNGSSTLFVPLDHSMASLARWVPGADGGSQDMECRVRRLDDLVAAGEVSLPEFIKCDVEGAELKAFRGGRGLLDRADAPIVLFEANVATVRAFGFDVDEPRLFLAGLEHAKYSFYRVGPGGVLGQLGPDQPFHSNILAVPESRTHRLG